MAKRQFFLIVSILLCNARVIQWSLRRVGMQTGLTCYKGQQTIPTFSQRKNFSESRQSKELDNGFKAV